MIGLFLVGWAALSFAAALVAGRVIGAGSDGAISVSLLGLRGSGSFSGAGFGLAGSNVGSPTNRLCANAQAAERREGHVALSPGGDTDRLPAAVAPVGSPSRTLAWWLIGCVFGALLAAAVWLPQLAIARGDAAGTRDEYQQLLDKCTVYVNGSMECPAGTVRVAK